MEKLGRGMAKEVGHQVSRNEGWSSNHHRIRVQLATKIIPILCARILLYLPKAFTFRLINVAHA